MMLVCAVVIIAARNPVLGNGGEGMEQELAFESLVGPHPTRQIFLVGLRPSRTALQVLYPKPTCNISLALVLTT